ncbi:MAG: transporter [Magnetococcales bacterium]|nr:transporter [Magnetococcales bacterium]
MTKRALRWYRAYLSMPWLILAMVAFLALGATYETRYFTYDASSDALVAENDPELAYYLEVSEDFGSEAFLFLTYEPIDVPLFTPTAINRLAKLQENIASIQGVKDVTSILDVPLLRSPPIDITKMATDYNTLRSDDVDIELAQKELSESPLFRELLISKDGKSTAMRINLESDHELEALWKQRKRLRRVKDNSFAQMGMLRAVENMYESRRRLHTAERERIISDIRTVRDTISVEAKAYLGGVPMVASDMIRFVKKDIQTFGGVSLALIMFALFIFFRRIRWVVLPILTAGLAVVLTMGILALIRQPVTVISSNFVALLFIFSISFTVHLMVKYRELVRDKSYLGHTEMVAMTMTDKFAPCLYTALTTMAAFASLTASDIVPVDDFGWIMCLGMAIAFFANYTFFPAMLSVLRQGEVRALSKKEPFLTRIMCKVSIKPPVAVIAFALLFALGSWMGIQKLSVDSRFIDYFHDDTEIKQGLVYIDRNLGGTIPMDIILSFDPFKAPVLDEEDDFFVSEPDEFPECYWYTPDKIEKLRQMQEYLETLPEVGKIISLATLEEIARQFNNGEALGSVELAAVLGTVPDDIRKEFIEPYSTPEKGIMRMSLRMHETAPRHSRDKLIHSIEDYAQNEVGLGEGNAKVTGMNVLFNDMLKVLFQSQVSTIGYVVLATFIMFLILLRSPLLATVGVLPNILSAAMVLGFMGFMDIPLDMMTMTIAAIIIGIGVDDAIHYLHRFKQEIERGMSTQEAIETSHHNIGIALYFTSLTVIVGFSVLSMSNFIPTIYFGVLTALAMILALLVNLAVLPSLLMKLYKPKYTD